MRNSERYLSLGILLLSALLGAGCAVEAPFAGRPIHLAAGVPIQVQEVMELLRAEIDEDAILERTREYGIAARPTVGELRALRQAGASDRLIATILSAALLEPAECPPMPTIEFPFYLWPSYPLLPGFLPIPCWNWLEGRGQHVPRPEQMDP